MSKKRHTKEARIRAIREHEAGRSQAEICRQLNITAPTFYRWKKQLGMMTNSDAQRTLEKDNRELKQMLADGLLRERILKIVVEKTLSPRVLRELLPAVMAGTPCSQRFACKILGLRRNTARYRPLRLARYAPLEAALREIYAHHPQLGHRKAKAILNRRLRQEGRPLVGLRLVRRLRRRLCLCVPPPKRKRVRKGLTTGRVPTKATHARHVWTWDFVADITTVGGTFRILAIIDEHTKECVGHHVARSINAQDVMRTLAQAISEYGAPEYIRCDNGSEFIAGIVREGLAARNIKTLYIDPGSPWQNGFIESFNASFRKELLDREQFYTLTEARVVIADWVEDYNAYRPHGAIGTLTPYEFTGREPGLRPGCLTQEPSKTTLLEATQL